jgi:hypothetical protein
MIKSIPNESAKAYQQWLDDDTTDFWGIASQEVNQSHANILKQIKLKLCKNLT